MSGIYNHIFTMILLQLVLFQFIVALMYHAAALSVHAQYSQPDSRSLSHRNNTECPSVWYKFNQTTQDCQCIPLPGLHCDSEYASINPRHTLTYNDKKKIISEVTMGYKYLEGYNLTKEGYHNILLPNDISELNQYMCGPLNRRHYMCSECKNGYGLAIISEPALCANICYLCKDSWYDLLVYLSFNFIPLTVFYLFILVFQVRLTSAPMTCFIMYSQLVVLASYEECHVGFTNSSTFFRQMKFTDSGNTLRVGTKILLTLYGVFNLDFFHYILPPFCISSRLRSIHIFILGYISVFYPFILILLTWLCVELHGRNFRPIVCLWRPFHECFVRLRRSWNTKSDLIDAFASFLLLSYSKILFKLVVTFDLEEITYYSLMDGHESHDYAIIADTSIIIMKSTNYYFISMMCFTVLLFILFIIFPMFLLLFYPIKIFRNLLSRCICTRLQIFLNIFIEKFHCCYRDGLNGAKDMRSFSGIYFLLRIIVYSTAIFNFTTLNVDRELFRGLIFLAIALLIALSQPYKKTYMNIVDSILLSHTANLCYITASSGTLLNQPQFFLLLMYFISALPFIILLFVTAYRMVYGIFTQYVSSMQYFTLLKKARVKLCSRFISKSHHNLPLPATTYEAIN